MSSSTSQEIQRSAHHSAASPEAIHPHDTKAWPHSHSLEPRPRCADSLSACESIPLTVLATAAEATYPLEAPLFTQSRMLGPGGRSILEDSPEPKTQAAAFAGSNYADSAGGSLLLGAGFSQTQRLIHPYSQPPIPSEFKNSASVSSRMHFFKVTDSSEASSARIHTNNNPPSIASSSSSSKGIGNNRHICTWDGCGKAFKTHWHLLSHSNSHTNVKLFNCGVCELSFARKHDLSRHERSVHAVKAGAHVFACQVCGKGFGRVDSMKRHVKICKL